jgi:serine/threonine-protein kinase
VSEPAGKWQVSTGGGNLPLWSSKSREIFYVAGNRIMVAGYEVSGDSFVVRKPREWSSVQVLAPGYVFLDLAPDGKRVAALLDPAEPAEKKENVHVTFLLNFFDELRRRAPAP